MNTLRQPSVLPRCITFLITAMILLGCSSAFAQGLRYDNHREIRVPDYATLRLGPFYSSWVFSVSTGYRYVDTTGSGTDFVFANGRGRFRKDGGDFPVIATLGTRNYIVLTPHMDLDLSLGFRYEYYPLDTQDDEFRIYLPEEGVSATLSFEFWPTDCLRTRLYDTFLWRKDYLDTRGVEDQYGGTEFEFISNTVGVEGDLLLSRKDNLGFGVSRYDLWPLDDKDDRRATAVHSGHLLYEHELSEPVLIGLRGDVAHHEYTQTNRPTLLLHSYRVFTSAALTERTHAAAFVGYGFAEDLDEGDRTNKTSTTTAIYGAELHTQLSPSLGHGVVYEHGLRSGYDVSSEEFDALSYRIGWQGELAKAGGSTRYALVDPSDRGFNDYSDWTSEVHASYPLLAFLELLAMGRYSIRSNGDLAAGVDAAVVDPEFRGDYTTWAARLSTEVALSEHLTFVTYVEHIDRDADEDNLDYTRDIFAALLTYTRAL